MCVRGREGGGGSSSTLTNKSGGDGGGGVDMVLSHDKGGKGDTTRFEVHILRLVIRSFEVLLVLDRERDR